MPSPVTLPGPPARPGLPGLMRPGYLAPNRVVVMQPGYLAPNRVVVMQPGYLALNRVVVTVTLSGSRRFLS
jgi:hypothetical protein